MVKIKLRGTLLVFLKSLEFQNGMALYINTRPAVFLFDSHADLSAVALTHPYGFKQGLGADS